MNVVGAIQYRLIEFGRKNPPLPDDVAKIIFDQMEFCDLIAIHSASKQWRGTILSMRPSLHP